MLAALLALTCAASPGRVFVEPADAAKMVEAGAIVIDARRGASAPFLPHARRLSWWDLRDGLFRTGRLAPTQEVAAALVEIGVRDDRPVLVYGDADRGWGEEARIWWTIAYLGHPDVRILDGGIQAWTAAKLPTREDETKPSSPGRFTPRVTDRLRADHDAVAAMMKANAQIIDARTLEEYEGATPYLSFRGGHVPGAVRVEWRALLDDRGRVLPRAALAARLARFGLDPARPTVAYCTGGVRSAFVVAALVELGFADAKNYDGSWWDWSSRTDLPVSRASEPKR